MKNIAVVFSTLSLVLSGALCVGAYVTYKKAEAILNNPEDFVGAVVEGQIKKILDVSIVPNLKNNIKFPF